MATDLLLPSPRTRLLVAVGAAALVSCLILLGLGQRTDAWWYDRISSSTAQTADPRIVIVTIDGKSLAELGRWPWSRRVHARLIDELGRVGAQGTGLDLLLSDPALFDPEGDALLARAISRNGRVVLPVLAEPVQSGGQPVELLPIPEFAASAAALGHVDVVPDSDGVVRGVWLRAGQGSARWPSLSLALSQLNSPADAVSVVPGERAEASESSSGRWVRDYRVLIPYARNADRFPRVSYADVINQRVPASQLQGHWVLVGTAMNGMGDSLRVPGAVARRNLEQVEYEANVLAMLLQGKAITPMSLAGQCALSILLVVLPMVLWGLPGLRSLWRPLALTLGLTLLTSYALLHLGHAWFPPSAALLLLLAGAAFCGYRFLRRSRHAAQTDAVTGLANRHHFEQALDHEVRAAQRSHMPLSLLLLDIDHFREINASQGNGTGDAVLRTLARVLRGRARRPRDLIARLGGDEFAVLLPETSAQAAATIATTIHVDLANLAARNGHDDTGAAFTTSIGIHTIQPGEHLEAREILDRADAALFQARQGNQRSAGPAAS